VREAFLQMANDPEGGKVLESSAAVLQQASPLRFIVAKDAEFDNMRRFYRTALVKVELQ
jgi:phosphonate transport system substrate-binding protein